jgi:hypothetical protein
MTYILVQTHKTVIKIKTQLENECFFGKVFVPIAIVDFYYGDISQEVCQNETFRFSFN